jgi:hypothetical protein
MSDVGAELDGRLELDGRPSRMSARNWMGGRNGMAARMSARNWMGGRRGRQLRMATRYRMPWGEGQAAPTLQTRM